VKFPDLSPVRAPPLQSEREMVSEREPVQEERAAA
jgi:hypothetical protein